MVVFGVELFKATGFDKWVCFCPGLNLRFEANTPREALVCFGKALVRVKKAQVEGLLVIEGFENAFELE